MGEFGPIGEVEFAALDFESAGVERGQTDVAVQVGWARMRGERIDPASHFRSFLASDRKITWAARRTHGISDGDIMGAPPLLGLWPAFREALRGRVMVAHGAGTEQRFLRAFPMHGFGPWVDTLVLARAVYPGLPAYGLGEILTGLGLAGEVELLCPELGWHDALFDAVACLVFLRHVLVRGGLFGEPLDLLLAPDAGEYYARLRGGFRRGPACGGGHTGLPNRPGAGSVS